MVASPLRLLLWRLSLSLVPGLPRRMRRWEARPDAKDRDKQSEKQKIRYFFISHRGNISSPSLPSLSRAYSLSLDALEARKSGCGSGRSGDEEEEWRRPIGEARFPGMEPIRMVDFGENIKSRQIARIFVLSKFGSSGNGKKCGRYFCSHFSHNKSKAKFKLSNAKPTTYVKGQYNYPTLYLLPR